MNPLWNRETAKGAFHVFRPCGRIALFLLFFFFAKAHAGGLPSDLKAVYLLNRLAFGPRAGEVTRVHAVGLERYIRELLSPEAMDLPSSLTDRLEALPTLRLTPGELFAEYDPPPAAKTKDKETLKRAQQRARIPLEEASEARILRAVN